MIGISACLGGICCRYDGAAQEIETLKKMIENKRAIAICPEVLGGLTTPRESAEIVGGDGVDVWLGKARVMTQTGQDITEEFKNGAILAYEMLISLEIQQIIMKEKSPSCGKNSIYEGTFSGVTKKGVGVATAYFLEKGLTVISTEEWASQQLVDCEMGENEQLAIFNPDYELIGSATRGEVHQKGFWHETFHCWMYDVEDGELILYFQQRAAGKKDFPNQLDITAAGHLQVNEQVLDGFREVTEELGINLTPDSADYLGVFTFQINLPDFYDNEFTNVFVVEQHFEIGHFLLQEEEVAAIYAVPVAKLKELFSSTRDSLNVKGISQKDRHQKISRKKLILKDFCLHSKTYYEGLFDYLEKKVGNKVRSID